MANQKLKTKSWLERRKWLVENCEHYVYTGPRHPGVRRDMAACIDLEAVHPSHSGVLWVQACNYGDIGNHITKVLTTERCLSWLQVGLQAQNRYVIFGWSAGRRGPHRIVELSIEGASLARRNVDPEVFDYGSDQSVNQLLQTSH